MVNKEKILLVGDNPFHGVSHISLERIRMRGPNITQPDHAASLVSASLENGAGGFMFSVSDTTLAIIKALSREKRERRLKLYAIVPYAYEYVRLAVALGGIMGLGKKIGEQIILMRNGRALLAGLRGILTMNPGAFLEAYLSYEVSRIKKMAGNKADLATIYIHEVVTDMAVALNMEWIFRTHIKYMTRKGIKPGFHTSNLPYLVNRFTEWGIRFDNIGITTPFNTLGFQMHPTQVSCEHSLSQMEGAEVVIYNILAGGLLSITKATEYIKSLPNIHGIAVGVSRKEQAEESFRLLQKEFR